MAKPSLHVPDLEQAGFRRVGCWEARDGRLHCGTEIPDRKGVYAFSIDGVVQYVGLASKSLAKRLNFYRTPGPTQTTNIRLNRLILEGIGSSEIAIHVATPPDASWHGLPVSFAEGLEAGLIEMFDLPWNQRGTNSARHAKQVAEGPLSPGLTLLERVVAAIMRRPGMTEAEIAGSLFGRDGYQQKINPACRRLLATGKILREGKGGPGDPFTYRINAR